MKDHVPLRVMVFTYRFFGMKNLNILFMYMANWLKQNSWAIIIAGVTVVSSYAVYGYRIDDLDKRVTANTAAIQAESANNLQVQVSLGKIQTDIEYIKAKLDRLGTY